VRDQVVLHRIEKNSLCFGFFLVVFGQLHGIYRGCIPPLNKTPNINLLQQDLKSLVNLGHFATVISMLVQRSVVEMAMNLGPPKCCIMCHGNCDHLRISSPKRQPKDVVTLSSQGRQFLGCRSRDELKFSSQERQLL
jgi:hypothetical protein